MFIGLGFLYTVSQTILIREFLIVFYGNEIIIGIFFAAWFFWIGLGSFVYGRWSEKIRNHQLLFIILQIILPFLLIIQLYALWHVRSFLNIPPSEILSLGTTIAASFIIAMPLSLCAGIFFPLGCRISAVGPFKNIQSINTVYIFETIGSIIGGIIFSLWLAGRFSHITIILCLILLIVINIRFFLWRITTAHFVKLQWITYALMCCTVVILFTPLRTALIQKIDTVRWQSIQPNLAFIESKHTRYQHIAIGKRGDQYSVLGDGSFISSFPEKAAPVQFAATLFAQKPDAKKILLIGGGLSGLLRELLVYPIDAVDYVEQDQELIPFITTYLSEEDKAVLHDKRLAIHLTDGRKFVRSLSKKNQYDIIIINLPEPSSAYLNRYYTIDFYTALKPVLAQGGLVCTGAVSAENYFGEEMRNYSSSIYHTLKRIFPFISIAPGEDQWYYAGLTPGAVTSDYKKLMRAYTSIDAKYRRFPPEGFKTLFPPERVAFVREELNQSKGEINTDAQPVTYYFNLLLWSNFSGSEWVKVLKWVRRAGIWFFIIPFAILVIIGFIVTKKDDNIKNRFNACLSVWTAGFIGMALQIILMFLYQSLFGYVYERIGLITGLFMAGLMAGVIMVSKKEHSKPPARGIAVVLLSISLFLLFIRGYMLSQQISEIFFFLLFVITGFLTGCMFPLGVCLYYKGSQKFTETAGFIDSADHIGAMIGSLVSGALLVPLLGIHMACAVLSVYALLTCSLVLYSLALLKHEEKKTRMFSVVLCCVWLFVLMSVVVLSPTKKSISESLDFYYVEKPFAHYRAYDSKKRLKKIMYSTQSITNHIHGYAGPINLFISLFSDTSVENIWIIESQETPEYIVGIDRWMELLKGRTAPIPEKDIDALTKATVTCDAIIKIVNESVRKVRIEIMRASAVLPETAKLSQSDVFNRVFEAKKDIKKQVLLPRGSRILDDEKLYNAFKNQKLSSKEALFYKKISE